MARCFVLLLVVLSIGMMGASSCTFVSNTSNTNNPNNPDAEKEGESDVPVVVGTSGTRSADDSRSDSTPEQAAIIRSALAPSVLSLPSRSAAPAPDRTEFERAASETLASFQQAPRVRRTGGAAAVPEPTAALSFAVGAFIVAQRLRNARFRS
jgi:hypothetical protein